MAARGLCRAARRPAAAAAKRGVRPAWVKLAFFAPDGAFPFSVRRVAAQHARVRPIGLTDQRSVDDSGRAVQIVDGCTTSALRCATQCTAWAAPPARAVTPPHIIARDGASASAPAFPQIPRRPGGLARWYAIPSISNTVLSCSTSIRW